MYDLIIIGSGPAGLSAAVYAKRAMLKAVVVEQLPLSGGQIINTTDVDNYLGLPGIGGFELAQKFRSHADGLGVEFINASVLNVRDKGFHKEVSLGSGEVLSANALIIATGAKNRLLGASGEQELTGKGVSYCATCDGAFYKGKTAAVVGGGDVALEDAIYLSRICKKVYVIHRRDSFRGAKYLGDKLRGLENVEILWDTVVESINGDDRVESVNIRNLKNDESSRLELDGVFIAVGISPNSELVRNLVYCDDNGYIKADEGCKTSLPGIFAAGDVRTKPLRQVVTAVSDGAASVMSAERYLESIALA